MSGYAAGYYKRYKNFNYARLSDFIIEDLKLFFKSRPKQKARLIVDIGCGIGRIADIFQHYSEMSVGLDISSDAIKMANRGAKSFFIAGNALSMPIKDKVCDICSCIHVIEHVKEFDLLLKEMYRITANGGKVIFITPNRKYTRFSLPFLKDKTHIREFAIDELKKALSDYFYVEKIKPVSMFTSFGILNPLLNVLLKPDIYISAIKI